MLYFGLLHETGGKPLTFNQCFLFNLVSAKKKKTYFNFSTTLSIA